MRVCQSDGQCATLSVEGDLIVGDNDGTVHILNIDDDDAAPNTIENAHAVRYLLTGSGRGNLTVWPRFVRDRSLVFGERAFSVAAAEAWNDLPLTFRNAETFKRRLQTDLFCKFYQLQ